VTFAIPGLTVPSRSQLEEHTERELERAAETPEPERTAYERVSAEYNAVADSADRRASAATTANGFALALTGLLFNSRAIDAGFLTAFGVTAIAGFASGLWSQLHWTTTTPGAELTPAELEEVRKAWVAKEVYFILAAAGATLALAGCTAALIAAAL
jgi:hypothetical protein